MNLEDYLKSEIELGKIDFRIRANVTEEGLLQFYIHPADYDGKTANMDVYGSEVVTTFVAGPNVKADWKKKAVRL